MRHIADIDRAWLNEGSADEGSRFERVDGRWMYLDAQG